MKIFYLLFKIFDRTYLNNNLSAHCGVAKRFKMLTYYVYALLFHPGLIEKIENTHYGDDLLRRFGKIVKESDG